MLKAPSAYSKLLDMSRILTYIAVLLCFITFNERSYASESNDANRRYAVRIDIRNAYISGVCIMHPYASREYYSLCNFDMSEVEIVDQMELPGMSMGGM